MKAFVKVGIVAGLAALARFASAANTIEFQSKALSAALAESPRRNVAFSPLSFEIDAAVFGGAMDAISRAAVAETIGTLGDFETVYSQAATNLLVARAFVLSDLRLARTAERIKLAKSFATQVCGHLPKGSAESYLKVAMEGRMEDFSVPDLSIDRHYQFFDLVYDRIELPRNPSARTGEGDFRCANGTRMSLKFLEGDFHCAIRRYGTFQLIRLPLADERVLYLAVPDEGVSLADVASELGGARLAVALASFNAVGDSALKSGVRRLSIPLFDICVETNLRPLMTAFKIPVRGFEEFHPEIYPVTLQQRMRLELAAAEADTPLRSRLVDPAVVRLDHPFLFHVIQLSNGMVREAGQFTGVQ